MVAFQQRFRGRNKVDMRLWMDIPKRPEEIGQARIWNKMVKDSLRETLAYHHNKHMPRHFRREARERYSHKPRSEKYKAWKKKRFGSITDLVMTGSTKQKLTRANGFDKIQIGGAAEGGKKALAGKLIYTFGFNDKLVEFYRSQKGNRTRDRRAQRAASRGGRFAAVAGGHRVTLRDMRAELQKITPDEADALRGVFEQALWGRVESYKAGRKRVGRK